MASTVAETKSSAQEYGSGLRVAIIGAGVSGLAACKHFTERGLNATVFEGTNGLGGVWRVSYSSTKLQTPRFAYQFSDFPWPESAPLFPSYHQVVDYLENYTIHFGIREKIRFNSHVVEVKRKMTSEVSYNLGTLPYTSKNRWIRNEGTDEAMEQESRAADFLWEVCVRKTLPRSAESVDYINEWLEFDYLVMCCGRFGGVAKLPTFLPSQGPDVFHGQVLHSLNYCTLDSQSAQELLRGKKVVVVGFQKTAIDIAVEVADINQGVDQGHHCTMVFRRTHWFYPGHNATFGLWFARCFATRLSEYWTPKPGQGFMQWALQGIFEPVRFLVWKLLEYYLRFTIPVGRFGLVPEHSLYEDLSGCSVPMLPHSLLGHLESGRIIPKKSPSLGFYSKGVRLADGTDIDADIVILCTGYDGDSKLKAILPKEYRDILLEPEGMLTLYRGIVHPQIPNVGFLGYQEGISSVHSSELGAVWLAQLLRKKFALPDNSIMEIDRRDWLRHLKITTPFYDRRCVAPLQIWHNDKLCQDIGSNFLRKNSWWEEIFSIYSNADYQSLSL